MNIKPFLTLILIVLLFSACKDDNNANNSNTISFFSAPGGTTGGYSMLTEFDNPNLIGLVELITLYRNDYSFDTDGSGNFTTYQGRSFDLLADIANPQRTDYVSLKPANLVVNYFQLQEYETGNYYIPSHIATEGNLENHFGSGYNKIQIDSNQYFNGLEDSVAFATPIAITNVSVGNIVSRTQDFIVNFSGASDNSLIEYELLLVNREFNTDTNSSHTTWGARNMIRHNEQIIIPTDMLEMLKSGYYSLVVRAYEPKYISLSNGKQICVMGTSIYSTTIQIVD